MATGSLIRQSYLEIVIGNEHNEARRNKLQAELNHLNATITDSDFLTPLNFFLGIIDNTHALMFRYMPPEKKAQLLHDLQIAHVLLIKQKKFELDHQKTEHKKKYDTYLKKCSDLIDLLNYEEFCAREPVHPTPIQEYRVDGAPINYLAILVGQELANKIIEYWEKASITKNIEAVMGWVNEKRLYWVWGSSLIKTMLEQLPTGLDNLDDAKENIKIPDLYTGTLSYGLYYLRFGMKFLLVLKHTIKGFWMNEEEATEKTAGERFLTQLDLRKFNLLNDFCWATANLVCFFWLNGSGTRGAAGDLLTTVLLLMDVSLAIWDFEEQRIKYNKEMLDYETTINQLRQNIIAVNDPDEAERRKQIQHYELQLNTVLRAQKQCKAEWEFNKASLMLNMSYAVSLLCAFVLLTAPFLPISALTLATTVVLGSVLCFAFSLIYNAAKNGMEIYKAHVAAEDTLEQLTSQLTRFKELLKTNPNLHDDEKKLLYLEIKQTQAEFDYQQEMVIFQTLHFFRSLIFEACLPALIMNTMIFFPASIMTSMAAVTACGIASNVLINQFTPEKAELQPLNDDEYHDFCTRMTRQNNRSFTFFQPSTNQPVSDDASLNSFLFE